MERIGVPSEILLNSYQVRATNGNQQGSAHVIRFADQRFLITANHLFKGASDYSISVMKNDGNWQSMSANFAFSNEDDDIAVYYVDDGSWGIPLKMEGLIYGQDCWLAGYPSGVTDDLQMQDADLIFPLPILARGVITRFNKMIAVTTTTPVVGMSGGAVVIYHRDSEEYRSVGMVIQSINVKDKVFDLEDNHSGFVLRPYGIKAISAMAISDAIRNWKDSTG